MCLVLGGLDNSFKKTIIRFLYLENSRELVTVFFIVINILGFFNLVKQDSEDKASITI